MSENERAEQTWRELVAAHRAGGAGEVHAPRAAVLACADARVPPSIVFDQPAGTLFTVRIAGNTAGPAALASLDYAVDQLGVDLVVVLGHTGCGAVGAAAAGVCDGYVAPVVAPICELAAAHPDASAEELVHLNVDATVAALVAHDGPTGQAARRGSLDIRAAVHDLVTGELLIHRHPPTPTERP